MLMSRPRWTEGVHPGRTPRALGDKALSERRRCAIRGADRSAEGIVEVGPYDAIRFDMDTMRDVEAGPEGVQYPAFGAGDDPRDAEMVQDWWSDSNRGYVR